MEWLSEMLSDTIGKFRQTKLFFPNFPPFPSRRFLGPEQAALRANDPAAREVVQEPRVIEPPHQGEWSPKENGIKAMGSTTPLPSTSKHKGTKLQI